MRTTPRWRRPVGAAARARHRVGAVLGPAQERNLRGVTGLGDAPLDATLTGMNKAVLVAPDRVFLLPRQAASVPWLERELSVYDALQEPVVPRLLGRWHDPAISPFPFAAVTRLPGAPPSRLSRRLTRSLGHAVGRWHELAAPAAVRNAPWPAHLDAAHHRWLRRALDPATTGDAAREAAERLEMPASGIVDVLARASRLAPVLVHGDVHEDQLLVERGELVGVIDWETARVDHPFWDFDLGEWGTRIWRRHRRALDRRWQELWGAYAPTRDVDPDPRPLIVAFRLRTALWLAGPASRSRDPAVVGTVEEHTVAVARLVAAG